MTLKDQLVSLFFSSDKGPLSVRLYCTGWPLCANGPLSPHSFTYDIIWQKTSNNRNNLDNNLVRFLYIQFRTYLTPGYVVL